MFISLPNEQAFGVAQMWLPLQIPAWNKEYICACSAAALQPTSSFGSCLLMLAPVFCLWFLSPDKMQLSISGLTLYQPSTTRKTRATEALVHYPSANCATGIGFVNGVSLFLLRVQLATYTGFYQEVDHNSQLQHKLFTVILFLKLLNTHRKISVKK